MLEFTQEIFEYQFSFILFVHYVSHTIVLFKTYLWEFETLNVNLARCGMLQCCRIWVIFYRGIPNSYQQIEQVNIILQDGTYSTNKINEIATIFKISQYQFQHYWEVGQLLMTSWFVPSGLEYFDGSSLGSTSSSSAWYR